MKIHWHIVFFLIVAFMGFSDAQANGGIFDSPHRASGNLLSLSSRFKLDAEQLDIKLNASDYVANVTYHLIDSQQTKDRTSIMYFPVICGRIDKDFGLQKYNTNSCIQEFSASINGQAIQSAVVLPEEVENHKVLYDLAKKINSRFLKNGTNYKVLENGNEEIWQEAYKEMLLEEPSKYVFFKMNIPVDVTVKILAVHYKANYQQISDSASSSIHNFYHPGSMIYDFFPAAAWMGNGNKELTIRLDISDLQSSLLYDKKYWPFVENLDEWTLKVHNPDFAKLPPLMLTTNNGNYLNFVEDMNQLKKSSVKYSIKAVGSTISGSKYNDVGALFDQNPNTFWCWKGKTATLEIQLDPFTIHDAQYRPENKLWSYKIDRFEGLVFLNGATINKKTFDQFGLPRKLEATSQNATPGKWGAAELPLPVMKDDHDKFEALTTLDAADLNRGGDKPLLVEQEDFTSTTEVGQKQIKMQKILLKISDVYKNKDTDESCISEIYPIYNGG